MKMETPVVPVPTVVVPAVPIVEEVVKRKRGLPRKAAPCMDVSDE